MIQNTTSVESIIIIFHDDYKGFLIDPESMIAPSNRPTTTPAVASPQTLTAVRN